MKFLQHPRFQSAAFRPIRVTLGFVLVVGGAFGFLPVLGFWMIPLGVMILSTDIPLARRIRRRVEVWCGRRRQRRAKQNTARE